MVEWNGVPMTPAEPINGHAAYTFEVPEGSTLVIFNNGTVQTDKTVYVKGATYYAVDQLTPKGRYQCEILE